MMRLGKSLAVVTALLIPALAAAAVSPASKDALNLGRGTMAASTGAGTSTLITVPVDVSNLKQLAAVDMPLQFGKPGDGIELKEVRWDERVMSYDVKVANIDNEAKTVIIGLVPMAFDPSKPRMEAGAGRVAELVFEITDATMESFTLDAFTTQRPHHRLMWVYSEQVDGKRTVGWTAPEFAPVTIDIRSAGSSPTVVPTRYALNQNYPNPFNAGTAIAFDLPMAGDVTLAIYNVLGQSVRTFSEEGMEAGQHTIQWDGSDNNGNAAASGIYFYRIQANDFVATKKMTLLK